VKAPATPGEPLPTVDGRSRPGDKALGSRRTITASASTRETDARASRSAGAGRPVRRPVRAVLEVSAAVLVVALLLWYLAQAVLALGLLAGALGAALVLTALLEPTARVLRRLGLPPGLAAGLTTLTLVGALAGLALLVYRRSTSQLSELPSVLTVATEQARLWLVSGPLQLDPSQVTQVRNVVVERLATATPSAYAGAMSALRLLAAAALVIFAVFFLLKDGASMWRWLLGWTPVRHRAAAEVAGTAAWHALTGYVRGIVIVATVDAVAIGAALLALGVPLWLSLTILTFFGAFLPVIGATVAGAVAVVVTLVIEGGRDAVIVLVVVLVVQQLEGNLLHPLIMGRALRLHPLAILCAVTAGGLLLGVIGALIAVPLTAVTYSAAAALRSERPADREPVTDRDGATEQAEVG
jgi:predicted PurR-regulated permease PerM